MEQQPIYHEDQKVWLKANEAEGWPREQAEIYEDIYEISDSKTTVVEILNPDDPELGEVVEITTDQIEGPVT